MRKCFRSTRPLAWLSALARPLIAAGLLALSACGGNDDPPPPSASATIGAAGGTIDGPDGVRIEVPAGALTQDTVIRVTKTAAGAPQALPDGMDAAPVYEFTPHGIDFRLPVTISLPTPAGDPAQQQVFMASPGDTSWRGVDSASSGGRTAWQVFGFSWGVVGVSCKLRFGDPFACQWPKTNGFLSARLGNALTFLDAAPAFAIKSYRLTAAGTVDVQFDYSGAADCVATVAITRWQPGVRDANGRVIVTSLVPAQTVALTVSGPRGSGQSSVPVDFTSSDNGEHDFGLAFTCQRPGQAPAVRYGGVLRLTVEIPVSALTAPAVTTQPTAATVQAPATATFTVAASGTPTPTVQWQRSDNGGASWADIGGATALSYTTAATAVVADNGSQYRAVFTNSQGTATSQPATLTVNAPPVVTASLSLVAGSLTAAGATDGTGAAARFDAPGPIALDAAGNAYITGAVCTVRKVTPAGVVTTLAGAPGACSSVNGTGTAARFNFPSGIAVDAAGNIYVAENFGAIRKITPAGVVMTIAGADMTQDFVDGPGLSARFSTPGGLTIDASGNLYLADRGNAAIRKIDAAGNVSTVFSGNANGNPVVDGAAGTGTIDSPVDLVVTPTGTIYFTEGYSVRKIVSGVVTTVAGSPARLVGSQDGTGLAARFSNVGAITVDPAGNLYAVDRDNKLIRKITPAGVVTTVLGVVGQGNIDLNSTPPHIGFSASGIAATGTGQFLLTSHPVVLRATVP